MEIGKQMRIGVQDRLGEIVRTVSMDDLVATGDSYQIHLMNYGKVGSTEYELLVQDEEQLEAKVKLVDKLKGAKGARHDWEGKK
jgi:hypothetical protein